MLGNPWFMLLIGFIGGWLVEWVIDMVYFRPRMVRLIEAELQAKESEKLAIRVTDQQKRIEDLSEDADSVQKRLEAKIAKLEQDLKISRDFANGSVLTDAGRMPNADIRVAEPRIVEKVYAKAVTREPLRLIKGIGPKYEELLWKAGILRFEQLSLMEPNQIASIIQPEAWKKLDYESWISDAKKFAMGEPV